MGAVAASGDDQRASALGIGEAEMDGGEAAHRQADDVGLVDLERVEHGADVVAGARLRVLRDVVRHVGGRIAARVVGDAAVAPAEMAKLRLPGAHVACKFVHEQDRRAGSDLVVIKLHAVVGGEMGHGQSPVGGSRSVHAGRRARLTQIADPAGKFTPGRIPKPGRSVARRLNVARRPRPRAVDWSAAASPPSAAARSAKRPGSPRRHRTRA